MTVAVLPRPLSSASTAFMPWAQRCLSQLIACMRKKAWWVSEAGAQQDTHATARYICKVTS